MHRTIRLATYDDIPAIMPVIDAARKMMHASGNVNQWINGYPSEEVIHADIARDGGFMVTDDERIVAYFAFLPAPEPTYEKIYDGAWLNDEPYYVIHRLASWPDVHGIWDCVLEWAFERTCTLRVDTHRDNHIMQHNILKHGFTYCGIIYLLSGDERLAYQKTISLQDQLFALQDKAYADFQSKLLPTVSRETVIGVRTPDLRKMAKQICKTPAAQEFLHSLPHRYFDENQLHAFILSEDKDFNTCIANLEQFLPYVDNWATCDQLSPKCFKKHTTELLPYIRKWMKSTHTYTKRFGMGMLMRYYLDGEFKPEFLEWVASIKSDEYYIRMMQAWFFATALAKQWDATLPYIEQHRLHPWMHNKTIQKAIESYRITDEQKALLRTFRVTGKKKETPSEEDVSECLSLNNYRTFVEGFGMVVRFIEWYNLYQELRV